MASLKQLPGLRVVDQRVDADGLIVRVVPSKEAQPACPSCGLPLVRHGRRTNQFADTPFEGQPVRLEIDRPRYRCTSCRITQSTEIAALDTRHRATKRLVNIIRKQASRIPLNSLAKTTGLAVNTIRSIARV